jgi:hypothetical protein
MRSETRLIKDDQTTMQQPFLDRKKEAKKEWEDKKI